jgi:hypothetical protein
VTPWNDLPYIGSNDLYAVASADMFPETGDSNRLYKANDEKSLY